MKDYDLNKMSIIAIIDLVSSDTELKLAIADNMKQYGGSFVQALAECFYTADVINARKLTAAFMEYVLDYQPKKWKS